MAATSKPWVDGPFKLISSAKSGDKLEQRATGARQMAAEMTLVHNLFIRGINAVYLQSINVTTRGSDKDKLDFANFACLWGEFIHEHHTMEEEEIFPEINKLAGVPGLMDGNVAEHALFHDGLDAYSAYLTKVKEGKEPLDGEKLNAIIDSFMPVVRDHLEGEIDTLVALEKYKDKCDWGTWFMKVTGEIAGRFMKISHFRTTIFPLGTILHDKTYEGGIWPAFPPIPWIAAVIMRWMFYPKHQDWWRFAGCDASGKPQDLPFA